MSAVLGSRLSPFVRCALQLVVTLGVVLHGGASAWAGLFGGFGPEEGTYQRGTEQMCVASREPRASRQCESKSMGYFASLKLSRGTKQVGASAAVEVRKRGSTLCLFDVSTQQELVSLDTEQVLGDVGAIYLDASRRWVAVEYQARFAGRLVDELVVLPVILSAPAPAPVPAVPDSRLGKNSEARKAPLLEKQPAKAELPEFREALQRGKNWSRRRKTFSKAEKSLNWALSLVPGHPEVLYALALLHYKRKRIPETLEALTRLAASKHVDVPRWRVEARFDIRFKPLRGDLRFRNAVGISRPKGEIPTLYERLVALGGHWEQEGIPCEEAQVNLSLRRNKKQRFDLVIRSKCQGGGETTRLDGSWAAREPSGLSLRLPNIDVADDLLSCRIEVCIDEGDEGGEDCLRCRADKETEFLLRVVRR